MKKHYLCYKPYPFLWQRRRSCK